MCSLLRNLYNINWYYYSLVLSYVNERNKNTKIDLIFDCICCLYIIPFLKYHSLFLEIFSSYILLFIVYYSSNIFLSPVCFRIILSLHIFLAVSDVVVLRVRLISSQFTSVLIFFHFSQRHNSSFLISFFAINLLFLVSLVLLLLLLF